MKKYLPFIIFFLIAGFSQIGFAGDIYTPEDYLKAKREAKYAQGIYDTLAARITEIENLVRRINVACYAAVDALKREVAELEEEARELEAQRASNYQQEKNKWALLEREKAAYKSQKKTLDAEYNRAVSDYKKAKSAGERESAKRRMDMLKGEIAGIEAAMKAKEAAIRAEISQISTERDMIKRNYYAKLAQIESEKNRYKEKERECKVAGNAADENIRASKIALEAAKEQLKMAKYELDHIVAVCPACPRGSILGCGDGIIEGREQCDDGNTEDGDGCSHFCEEEGTQSNPTMPMCDCGNHVIENETDEVYPGVIRCSLTFCEDLAEIEGPHEGCTPASEWRSINYQYPEECDDGFTDGWDNETDGCTQECRRCQIAGLRPTADLECCPGLGLDRAGVCGGSCGDGIVNEGEVCDDGNLIDDDLCRNDCAPPTWVIDVCAIPTEATVPAGYTLRFYDDGYAHISQCIDAHSIEYVVCGLDETITYNTNACPEVSTCANGVCEEEPPPLETCTDSDVNAVYPDGINPGERGTVSGDEIDRNNGRLRTYSHTDICLDAASVQEIYCNGVDWSLIHLPCGSGEYCLDGACVAGEPPLETCTDSDVNAAYPDGINPGERGTVSGDEVGPDGRLRTYLYPDRCFYSTQVYERYCNGGRWSFTYLRCGYGEYCLDGACVAGDPPLETCTDTDVNADYPNGINPGERGTVSGDEVNPDNGRLRTYSYADGCIGLTRVYELRCTGRGGWSSFALPCGSGEYCYDGACVIHCDGVCRVEAETATTAGYVVGSDCSIQHNTCRTLPDGSFEVVVYECGAAGTEHEGMPVPSPETVPCPAGCRDGLCL